VDSAPFEVANLRSPKAVTVSDQDHGGVPQPVAIGLGGLDQRFGLARREVLTLPVFDVGTTDRGNCSVFACWRNQFQACFGLHFRLISVSRCSDNAPNTSSITRRPRANYSDGKPELAANSCGLAKVFVTRKVRSNRSCPRCQRQVSFGKQREMTAAAQ